MGSVPYVWKRAVFGGGGQESYAKFSKPEFISDQ